MTGEPTPLGDPAATARGGPKADPPEPPSGIWVRASIALSAQEPGWPNLARGQVLLVDPSHPRVRHCLEHDQLVPLPGQDWHHLREQILTDNTPDAASGDPDSTDTA